MYNTSHIFLREAITKKTLLDALFTLTLCDNGQTGLKTYL